MLIRCSLKDGDSRRNWLLNSNTNAVTGLWRSKDEYLSLESSGSVETRISTAMLECSVLWTPECRELLNPECRELQNGRDSENNELKEALCLLEAERYAYKEFHCMHSPLAVVSTCPFSFWRQFHHNFLIFIFPRLFFCPQRVGNVRKLLVAWEREKAP